MKLRKLSSGTLSLGLVALSKLCNEFVCAPPSENKRCNKVVCWPLPQTTKKHKHKRRRSHRNKSIATARGSSCAYVGLNLPTNNIKQTSKTFRVQVRLDSKLRGGSLSLAFTANARDHPNRSVYARLGAPCAWEDKLVLGAAQADVFTLAWEFHVPCLGPTRWGRQAGARDSLLAAFASRLGASFSRRRWSWLRDPHFLITVLREAVDTHASPRSLISVFVVPPSGHL